MIVAVAGGKGGVGKTTVALNLARALDAVLVDADLGMADVPASHGPDLHDVLAGRAAPLEAVREGGPVTVLPCGRSVAGAQASETTALTAAIRRVDRSYGDCVVDCPAGLSADAGLPLLAASCCVLVTTPDRVALPNAVRTWALANELDAGVARVALNRCGTTPPTAAVERALGAPVVEIPESDAVATATDAGRPLSVVAPDAAAVERFEALADGVRSCRGRP